MEEALTLQVKYEKATHELVVKRDTSVALLQTQLFIKTKVLPTRQKIIGFKAAKSDLPVTAGMLELQAGPGLKLMMLQKADKPLIDKSIVASDPNFAPAVQQAVLVMQAYTAAAQALLDAWHPPSSAPASDNLELMKKLVMNYHEWVLSTQLRVDALSGDEQVKAQRKAIVEDLNSILDRLESIKKELQDLSHVAPPTT